MENVLVVYRISDNRVLYTISQASGCPTLDNLDSTDNATGASLFDSTTMDYRVGFTNYEDSTIWDSTSGYLTDEAATALGIAVGEKTKYIKDKDLAVPSPTKYIDDLKVVWDGTSLDSIEDDPLEAVDRRTYLALTFNEVEGGGISDQGTDPYNGLPLWSAVTNLDTDMLEITVRKLLVEDNTPCTDASDDDTVILRVSGGKIFGDYVDALVNGVCTFLWQPTLGSGIATASVNPDPTAIYAPGKELLPGKQSIIMDHYPAPA